MKVRREQRLNSEFRKYVYDILKNDIKDENLEKVMFTVEDVETTADLKQAKVYVSIFTPDKEQEKKTFDAMKSSAPRVRQIISSLMHIRTVPEFNFILDKSFEYGKKIDDLIKGIHDGSENG